MGCPAAALTSRAGWSASRVQLCQKNDEQVVLASVALLHCPSVKRGGEPGCENPSSHSHLRVSRVSHSHLTPFPPPCQEDSKKSQGSTMPRFVV